jgi:uncharacterized protein (TIGR03437 family)
MLVNHFPFKPSITLLALAGTLCLAQTAPVSFTISTVAGNGTAGYTGDAAAANNAELNNPTQAWFVGGNLYIADQVNSRIREVTGGNINTIAGNGTAGLAGTGGAPTNAEFSKPYGVAVDSKSNVYISDTGNNLLWQISGSTINSIVGVSGTLAYGLSNPAGLAVDSAGNVYIADAGVDSVEKVSISGTTYTVTRIAGSGSAGQTGAGGPANKSQLFNPTAVAVSPAGDALYIADTNNSLVLKVSPISPTGTITVVAGAGTLTGEGVSAYYTRLSYPKGLAVDACGDLYISDTYNHRIRVVAPSGLIYTVAGTTKGYTGDGGPALSAQLNYPQSLSLDSSGNLYVADTQNNVVRMLTVNGSSPCALQGPPSISSALSLGQYGAFNAVAAPGSWIEIHGTNLAADTREWSNQAPYNDFSGVNAPTQLDRTSVEISNAAAFVEYISPTQLNVQVPSNVATGSQQLTVSTALGTSAPFSLQIDTVEPGLYAPPQISIGGKQYVGALFPPDLTNWVLPTGAIPGFTSHPASAGDIVVLYGIGFGGVTIGSQANSMLAGQIVPGQNTLTATSFQILFGQTPAVLQYWGLAPGAVGLYQFNVVVPSGLGSGTVPISFSMTVNGQTVNSSQTLYTVLQ